MDDTVEKVAERLGRLEDKVERLDQRVEQLDAKVERLDDKVGRLEVTVAKGLYSNDARITALNNKIDVSVEAMRGDIKSVADVLVAVAGEMRRTTESIRKEGAADREVLKLALQDHTVRLQAIEEWRRSL